MMLQRVAVIGAGAAGLCAARHILSRVNRFAPPVVYELTDKVGGTWCYDERVGTYPNGRPIHSSMYRDLRTNLPKEVMMFPDFPFDSSLNSFLPHHEVQRYLESYCQSHAIGPHIRFNTAVDSVCLSSQHYSDPHIPSIPGIHNFKGEVLHSHSYRYAEPYAGQTVVVLGAKASGLDISIELVKVGAKVTLSHRLPRITYPLPDGIQQSSPVVAVEDDGRLRFQDGSVSAADVLLLCTGYNFRYPFLDGRQLGLEIQDHVMTPLYRFLTPPAFPSLFFIGICKMVCPFPNFNVQVQFCLSVLDGSVALPSRGEMEQEVRQELQEKLSRGVEHRHLHVMQLEQWDYCDALASIGGFAPLPPVVRSLYEEVWRQRGVHPQRYRDCNYRLVSAARWEALN
ncbi:flavin-containing monooxygenase FMO GS-OX-like 4 [Perca fluviatilis]|uniref:flavin-containing monooxygenase FMO GS-OX-like 4 n=1 Tax=Perca fluviatilis TaxID=8168 RepID=UPI0019666B33|nr:flavin-containing monooxygenase FMO GS-OX-like 4 [Perca fluviatilis]